MNHITPWIRVVIKIGAFAFALFFILYFVIYGFRYTRGVGFVPQNGFYQAQFWSDGQKISFAGSEFFATDKLIQLYNLQKGCYPIKTMVSEKKECIAGDTPSYDVVLRVKGTKPYKSPIVSSCVPVSRQSHGVITFGGLSFSKPIRAVFVANEISFIQVQKSAAVSSVTGQSNEVSHLQDDLIVCARDYKNCYSIASVSGEPICSIKEGIVYNNNGKLFLLEIE